MEEFLSKDGITGDNDTGLFIMLTTTNPLHLDWEDRAKADGFRSRLLDISQHVSAEKFDKCVHIKRIGDKDHTKWNHCKSIGIDNGDQGKLLYIGSDNIYPNYNEEQGVWIDDKKAIDAWYDDFWVKRWKQSTPVDWNDGFYI